MSGESGSTSIDREEAVAYGVEGLIQAVDNYDPSRGTTFASFAIRRIRGSILDAGRRMDVLPRSLRRRARCGAALASWREPIWTWRRSSAAGRR